MLTGSLCVVGLMARHGIDANSPIYGGLLGGGVAFVLGSLLSRPAAGCNRKPSAETTRLMTATRWNMNNRNVASRPKIEVRSIDYVPRHERHGKVWHQAPFWFTGNFVLTTMVVGFTGPALGLGALYSMLAIAAGVGFGTFFMACHANQGPRMGLPQMIQSRAQFGLRGAIVPFAAVVFVYIGFNVFNVILATDAINTVLPGHRLPGMRC